MNRTTQDRRPVYWIGCFRGFPGGVVDPTNPQGLGNSWKYTVDDDVAVDWLIAQLWAAFAVADIAVINRWTGEDIDDEDTISSDPWVTFPPSRKAAIIARLTPAIAAMKAEKPSRKVLLYLSPNLRDDHDATSLAQGTAFHMADVDNADDAAMQHTQWDTLIDTVGIDGLIADNASVPEKQARIERMRARWTTDADFFSRSVYVSSEAVVRLTGNDHPVEDRYMPDASRVESMPFMSRYRFWRSNEASASELQETDVEWTFAVRSTEIGVLFQADESNDPEPVYPPTRADVQRVMRNGGIPWIGTASVSLWVSDLSRCPVPENVVSDEGEDGNTITWDTPTLLDAEGEPIAVVLYEILRSRDGGDYELVATTDEETYFDTDGLPGDVYAVGTQTEYGQYSIPLVASGESDEPADVYPQPESVPDSQRRTVGRELRTIPEDEVELEPVQKAPSAVVPFEIDWTDALGSDTIESSTWTQDSSDNAPTKSSPYNTDTVSGAWFSGGELGRAYQFTNTITTAGGVTDQRTLTIEVVNR